MAVASKKIPAPDLVTVKTALLSVSDKSGIVEFASALAAQGIRLLSTGGTHKALAEAGLEVTDVSAITGFPEIMDGRVKTLHPNVHGGLLAIRDDEEHQAAMREHGISGIDLAVINLYPFEEVRAAGGDYPTTVENIDIGGPAMIRAAAKNHAYVTVITDPADYDEVRTAIEAGNGAVPYALRQTLAARAYARTAAYDAAISGWFAEALSIENPRHMTLGGTLRQEMRYGENPHQSAAFYVTGDKRPGVANAVQHQGKQLSYNNINDTDAAFELVAEFPPEMAPACAIIKHANPCGVARAGTLTEAYKRALACDSQSAFGVETQSCGDFDVGQQRGLAALERKYVSEHGSHCAIEVLADYLPLARGVIDRTGKLRNFKRRQVELSGQILHRQSLVAAPLGQHDRRGSLGRIVCHRHREMSRIGDDELGFAHGARNRTSGDIALALTAGGAHFGRAFGFLVLVAHFLMAHFQAFLLAQPLDRKVDESDHHQSRAKGKDQRNDRLPCSRELGGQIAATQTDHGFHAGPPPGSGNSAEQNDL